MAIRNIRVEGDDVLYKTSKEIKEMTDRTLQLIDDMLDTMYDANGVGLAAPQVGILKRLFVIDVSEEGDKPYVFINPEILETSGIQVGEEGCLSVPGKQGTVSRPSHVKVKALDENMKEFVLEADELFARAILHENDHLNGILYTSKVEGELKSVKEASEQ